MDTFVAVIEAFGGAEPFAEAVRVPYSHARVMKVRDSIAPLYWPRMVAAAESRGLQGISYEMLTKLAEKKAKERAGIPTEPAEATQ